MLFGVRRDLQERLARAGFGVRVYVPFGTQWYPYFMRRLAERPANVAFVLRSILREGRSIARRAGAPRAALPDRLAESKSRPWSTDGSFGTSLRASGGRRTAG